MQHARRRSRFVALVDHSSSNYDGPMIEDTRGVLHFMIFGATHAAVAFYLVCDAWTLLASWLNILGKFMEL
jgi:hypothetical protein